MILVGIYFGSISLLLTCPSRAFRMTLEFEEVRVVTDLLRAVVMSGRAMGEQIWTMLMGAAGLQHEQQTAHSNPMYTLAAA